MKFWKKASRLPFANYKPLCIHSMLNTILPVSHSIINLGPPISMLSACSSDIIHWPQITKAEDSRLRLHELYIVTSIKISSVVECRDEYLNACIKVALCRIQVTHVSLRCPILFLSYFVIPPSHELENQLPLQVSLRKTFELM